MLSFAILALFIASFKVIYMHAHIILYAAAAPSNLMYALLHLDLSNSRRRENSLHSTFHTKEKYLNFKTT